MRQYLPTFAELVDRLAIVQLKQIYIPENASEYAKEIEMLLHDIGLLMPDEVSPRMLHAVGVLFLVNRIIWENESKARAGGSEQDKLLKFTHSINGVRAKAKNVISEEMGERKDLKVDSLAADLPEEFGNWRINL